MPEAYCIQEDGSVGILIHFAYAAPAGLMEQKGASFKTKTQAQWHVACARKLTCMHPDTAVNGPGIAPTMFAR